MMMDSRAVMEKIKGGLIVSCQALEDEPLHGSEIMARMALAAHIGGAVGIRSNSVEDINEIRNKVDLPIIGLIKRQYEDSEVYITPTIKEAKDLINSEADIIAIDATLRKRPKGESLSDIIKLCKESGKLVMGDISTYEEGTNALKLGVDIISTTLSGYTSYSPDLEGPDFELIEKLCKNLNIPIIAEGRITTPEQLLKCLQLGAYSVVIGSAVTRPQIITRNFVKYLEKIRKNP